MATFKVINNNRHIKIVVGIVWFALTGNQIINRVSYIHIAHKRVSSTKNKPQIPISQIGLDTLSVN